MVEQGIIIPGLLGWYEAAVESIVSWYLRSGVESKIPECLSGCAICTTRNHPQSSMDPKTVGLRPLAPALASTLCLISQGAAEKKKKIKTN